VKMEARQVATKADVPKFDELMVPAVQALKRLGGSASNDELLDEIASALKLSEAVRNVADPKRGMSELAYRLAWTRTYLKAWGALENSERGVWSLTDKGERVTDADIEAIKREVRAVGYARRKQATNDQSDEAEAAIPVVVDTLDWRDRLLAVLTDIKPDAFERLCQRVMRESGFTRVEVTGKSGDGGIDGIGVLRVNLVSFRVVFQAKRWKGSVGSQEIRLFQSAMLGRADKGLMITTGTFTTEARREATRDGAPAVDLVDGEGLCDLLRDLKLGVTPVTDYQIIEEFYRSI
jgi:restriction system protein